MTPPQLEQYRVCILQQLREVNPSSLPIATLATGARLEGFSEATDGTVRATVAYLADKGFATEIPKPLSPENKRYRITAAGIDFLAEAGL